MRQSRLFGKTRKKISQEETSKNAELLVRAGYIDKVMAGVYTYLPLGLAVLSRIQEIVRQEMNAIGGQEILMPALQPREQWETTGRWEGFDALFKVPSHSNAVFALGPTHEEIVVPLVKKFVQSYKDLPVALYQIQTKFRDEPRAKSGLLRGREFIMKDLYSFHASAQDLEVYYERSKQAYQKIFERVGLPTRIVEASGGTFSKYSHEFQVITPFGEDTIYTCQCGFAQNKEIATVKKGDACPGCGNTTIQEEKAIEVGNIFQLHTRFSDPFNLTFVDETGTEQKVIMGCYGIGPSRIMGTIAEIHQDEKGLQWPRSVAPFRVHLLRLGEDTSVTAYADSLYDALQKKGVAVLYDDRAQSPGSKFADSDLIGIPTRLIASEKMLKEKQIEWKDRDAEKPEILSLDECLNKISTHH